MRQQWRKVDMSTHIYAQSVQAAIIYIHSRADLTTMDLTALWARGQRIFMHKVFKLRSFIFIRVPI